LNELEGMISLALNLISQFENHKNDTKISDDEEYVDSMLNQKLSLLSRKEELNELISKESNGEDENLKDLE
jgi:hypothetical protein